MTDEIGYIVAVQSMREYRLRRGESGNGVGKRGERVVREAAERGPAVPDVGALVRIGDKGAPIVAVVTGLARAVNEDLQPYLPSSFQPKYLPSQEDLSDNYLSLYALGEMPGGGGDGSVDGGQGSSEEGGGSGEIQGGGSGGERGGGSVFSLGRVPELSDPVSLLRSEDIRRFHTAGGQVSLGYLNELSRSVEPDVLLRLLDRVHGAVTAGGTGAEPSLEAKFKAVRRYVERGAQR